MSIPVVPAQRKKSILDYHLKEVKHILDLKAKLRQLKNGERLASQWEADLAYHWRVIEILDKS